MTILFSICFHILYDLGGHNDFGVYKCENEIEVGYCNETNGDLLASFVWDVSPSGPALDSYIRKHKPHFVVITPGVLHPMQLVAKIENDPVYLLQPVFDQLEWDWRC